MIVRQKIDNIETAEDSQFIECTRKFAPNSTNKTKTRNKLHSQPSLSPHNLSLWKESSSSLTRGKAPSHKIPQARRFNTLKVVQTKFDVEFNQLNPAQKFNKTGLSFPKSLRPDHFVKEEKAEVPSPASYQFSRFLDSFPNKTQKSLSPQKKKQHIIGGTMNNFFQHQKSYVPHSQHIPYQPQCTQGVPGPGAYAVNWSNKRKMAKYTFRVMLKKFENRGYNQSQSRDEPGPGEYSIKEDRSPSFNAKGTFPKSHRTYLRKFEQFPSSHEYHLERFPKK